ncbi:AAA family ATPase [Thermorudis peleae]|uniref:AAA family ATPase n=1 Tax=Thermorudis peleae TaxID=1382356 RepID=UPI0005718E9E|nr:AAA family ATPase [Thermorudis peleae]
MTVTMLHQRASEYQSWGLPAIPIHQGTPLVKWERFKDRPPVPDDMTTWPWDRADGLAIICGHREPQSGKYWWVWDVEPQYRARAENWLDVECLGWRQGLVAESQRGGLHVYCLSERPVPTQKHPWGDIKGAGGLIFAPPTRAFKLGAKHDYRWLSEQPEEALELEPDDLPQPDAPQLNGHRQEPLSATLKRTIPTGIRHLTLVRVAGWLRGDGHLEPDEILMVLKAMNRRCEEPLPDKELEAIASSTGHWEENPILITHNGRHAGGSSPGDDERDAASSSIPDHWQPVMLTDLADEAATVEWLWDGVLAKGHLTDFYALWKSGKTTLVAALLQRMAAGGELAGRPVAPGKALVVSEEPKVKWAERAAALGLGAHVHLISRPFPKRPTHAEWRLFTHYLVTLVGSEGYDLVVFDALPNLWCVVDENDASETVSALLPLQAIASAGAAVLLLRHPRKGDGGQATAGRGSGAIAGFVDIIVEMRRLEPEQPDDTRRVLTIYSRYEPFEVVVRWDGDGVYETLGTPAAYAVEAQCAQLLAALVDSGAATTEDLAKATGLPYPTVAQRLKALHQAGRVHRDGSGKRGDPYRWSVPGEPSRAETAPGTFRDSGRPDAECHEMGDEFFSSRYTPKREEKNSGGKPDISHHDAEIANFAGAGKTGHDPGKPDIPHHEAKNGGQGLTEKTGHDPGKPDIFDADAKTAICEWCGAAFGWSGRGKPAKYCSDACRKKAARQQATEQAAGPAEQASLAWADEPARACVECGAPITVPTFKLYCGWCTKRKYDQLGIAYPEVLERWLAVQQSADGHDVTEVEDD